MKYHAEYLGDALQKAFQEFDPDDSADALSLILNEYQEKGLRLLTSVSDAATGQDILVFTVYQSGDESGEIWS